MHTYTRAHAHTRARACTRTRACAHTHVHTHARTNQHIHFAPFTFLEGCWGSAAESLACTRKTKVCVMLCSPGTDKNEQKLPPVKRDHRGSQSREEKRQKRRTSWEREHRITRIIGGGIFFVYHVARLPRSWFIHGDHFEQRPKTGRQCTMPEPERIETQRQSSMRTETAAGHKHATQALFPRERDGRTQELTNEARKSPVLGRIHSRKGRKSLFHVPKVNGRRKTSPECPDRRLDETTTGSRVIIRNCGLVETASPDDGWLSDLLAWQTTS